jgi:cyclophilin family peptidyl-prolyl cis-trans isomerase
MEREKGMTIVRAISRIVFYCRRHVYGEVSLRMAACAILAAMLSLPQLAAATTVRMITTLGTIDIQLYDDQAPKTVTNFLRYAGRGDYSRNGFIHRHATISTSGVSVIQGGGYTYAEADTPFGLYRAYFHIPQDPPVQNEFSSSRSNTRGTIAMAKLSGNPDSATSDWFINLADNNINNPTLNLDVENGGFTVFGQVLSGMNVADDIANLQVLDAWNTPVTCSILCNLPLPAFSELPVINYNSTIGLDPSNHVMVTSIPNVTATISQFGTTSAYAADVDMTFSSASIIPEFTAKSWLATFDPPPGKTVQFNDEISTFTMTWTTGPSARVVTLYHGANASVNRYYAYGPTPGNASPHWYDFTFDSTTGTGAEFVGDKILLHFVDGQRGDDDPTNGSVSHTGAPALVTDITTTISSNYAGCTIAAMPSQSTGNGDWVVVSLFLAFVALVRRRARNGRIQRVPR